MRLILLRHGIAAEAASSAPAADAGRPLTKQGRERTRRAVQGLAALEVKPQLILSSPLLRACQTAELAAQGLGLPAAGVAVNKALLPGADPRPLYEVLRGRKEGEVLCVGHAPHLDRALALALGASRQSVSQLKKAGAVALELNAGPPPRGRLLWLLEPSALRRLGRAGH